MRKTLIALLCVFTLTSCEIIEGIDNAAGLREALVVGARNATGILGAENGFLGDDLVRILLPQEAQVALNVLQEVQGARNALVSIHGIGGAIADLIPNFEPNFDQILLTAVNRAAEHAAATPQTFNIFANAITGMNLRDATDILFSGNTFAATDYLRANTFTDLQVLFSPIVNNSLSAVSVGDFTALSAWEYLANTNNNLVGFLDSLNPLVRIAVNAAVPAVGTMEMLDTDLGAHVTGGALTGLFSKVELEEEKIRTDVGARTSDLLQRVFGQLDN